MDSQILDMIDAKLKSLCNSIAELRKELTEVKIDVASLKADMRWLKKGYYLLAGVIVSAVGGYFLFK